MNKKNYFITGLFSIIPLAITYYIIVSLISIFSKPGQNLIKYILPEVELPLIELFIGFTLTFLFIYFLGLIISNVLGKKLYNFFENILSKIPLVSYIYNTIKQITETLTISQKQAFKKVVYIEYPKENIWTIALVTGESRDKTGVDYYQIFVPTTPNPTSGFMLYIKKSDAKETNLSIDEGLKIVISGGMLAPKQNEI
ncbi:MAG: hypothetical protein CMG25_02690 [Candidatus Marinimicrobia bacterium]|nr:hypothetical protein [Candidatus Neomarinimicrobiota bacterium]|tara:strand:+ start:19916 stop:20509 length:594 start_codon:yes stop_codon:yes gene_type:complete